MKIFRVLALRLAGMLSRDRRDRELSEELESHVQLAIDDNVRSGMTPEEARRAAVIKLGGIEQTKEKYRDRRGVPWLETLAQDVRYGARVLRKNLGFTAVAIITLALGIGANTAIFSVVHAVLLRPLPYPNPDRLAVLWGSRGAEKQLLVSIPNLDEWRARNHSFEDIGIMRSQSVNLTGTETPDRLIGNFVSASTLRLLGARTSAGRLFRPEETVPGSGAAVAVLSHAAWSSRFGGDPRIVGRTVTLNGRPHVVIGVTEPDFQDAFGPTDVWLPISSAPNPRWFTRSAPEVWAIGRLKPGISIEDAGRDLSVVASQLASEYPADNAGTGATVVPLRESVAGSARPILLIAFAFVAVVLVIACANVANLQLARSAARRREMSVRAALGAGSRRLARQLFTENLLLAAFSGAAGFFVARWTTRALVSAVPGGLPAFGSIGLSVPVMLFSAVVTLAAGFLFGAAPARFAARADLCESLRERAPEGAAGKKGGARGAVVGAQLALCVVLLVGAGLLTRSLIALERVNPGFDPSSVLTAEFRLPAAKYTNDGAVREFQSRALSQIRAMSDVRSAALVTSVPLSGNWDRGTYAPDDRSDLTAAQAPVTQMNIVSDGFFRTMGIPLLRGRDFDERDRSDTQPVAIVNETLARRAWPSASPLGRRLKLFGPPEEWVTIVGVVGDLKQLTLGEPATPQLYGSIAQNPGIFASVVARTEGDPMRLAKPLCAAIWSVDPDQPVWKVRTLSSLVSRDFAMPRFMMGIAVAFALLALALAAAGVYGVMSYAAARRTREIGIRMALGARPAEVVRMMLGQGLSLVGIAGAAGVVLSLGAARLLRNQLFGVEAGDPLTLVVVVVILAGMALTACYLPARRAVKVSPVIALREE